MLSQNDDTTSERQSERIPIENKSVRNAITKKNKKKKGKKKKDLKQILEEDENIENDKKLSNNE